MKYKIEEEHRTGDTDHPLYSRKAMLGVVSEPISGRDGGTPD